MYVLHIRKAIFIVNLKKIETKQIQFELKFRFFFFFLVFEINYQILQ
jgi:hypothetical protein